MNESSEEVFEVDLQWGLRILLRDGVELSATLYAPRKPPARGPAIFTLTPYVAQTYHDVGMSFAAHSLYFLTVDVRGRGNSGGEFQPFVNEGRDGHDIVEWIARQPWCNGQVAMWGGSYAGFDQWMTATEFPPHLATIAPVASPYLGVDFPMRNNVSFPYLIQWLTLVWGRTSQDRLFWDDGRFWSEGFRRWFELGVPFRQLDAFFGQASEIFQSWMAHPTPDLYWDRQNPTVEQYARLTLPILTITGSYDDDQPGALTHYREHLAHSPPEGRSRHYLVIGPWDHAGTRQPQAEFIGLKVGPEGLLDLLALHRAWYAWTLSDGSKPAFLKKNVAYYVMGAERWRYADTLEAITGSTLTWYLNSFSNPIDVFHSGLLSTQLATTGAPDQYIYDPADTRHAELNSLVHPESAVDQRLIHALSGSHLIYHSSRFESDCEISGFFKLHAWLSIDRPDTDFRVVMYEIDSGGGSVLLTTDLMRARYREDLRQAKLVSTIEPKLYLFERFTFISRLVRKGSRLRLVIGPINSIYFQKNYNSGAVIADESMPNAQLVTVKLYHDAQHPSALYVPLGAP